MMEDLLQFLRDRYNEEVALAQAADGDQIEATNSLWGTKYLTLRGDHEDRHTTELPAALADHIARHDPARVLAEVEARQEIVALHRRVTKRSTGSGGGTVADCSLCDHFPAQYPCMTLRLLALPYADHPDYNEAWRP